MISSFELFSYLISLEINVCERDPFWWPQSGTFKVLVGAVLTQQTKWERVDKSLENLESAGLLSLQAIAVATELSIVECIKPSGFYNTKAKRLKALCAAISKKYGNFETFCERVDREWLLTQKGIGPETADSILCYACYRDVMVVDAYTARLLAAKCSIEELSYDEMQEWLVRGMAEKHKEACSLINENTVSFCKIYALFHALIVEYSKQKKTNLLF